MTFFKRFLYLNQLDRYILFNQVKPFGFFSMVFIGILWLVQSLPRLDDIISNGQSGDVFLKVAILMLPQVMILVIPLAAFAATLYSINQLFLDAEFIIFMSVGRSNISISRAILVFGTSISLFMYILGLYLVPASQHELRLTMFEIRQSITGQLIKAGRFFHPTDGVSLYIRDSNKNGEMRGIFITDSREENFNLTYSAREAVLHETKSGLLLVMQNGLLQIASNEKVELTTITFERLGLNMDNFFPETSRTYLDPREVYPYKILTKFDTLPKVKHDQKSDYVAEAHLKFATPITPIALTLLGLTIFLVTGYRRQGFSISIYFGILIGLIMQASTLSFRSLVASNNSFFWMVYSPSIIVIIACLLLLTLSQRLQMRDNQN